MIRRYSLIGVMVLLVSLSFGLSVVDDEFSATTSDNFAFMKGDGLSHILPNGGSFSSLTDTSQGISWTASSSGGGSVEITTTGFLNLKCLGAGTAAIELSTPVIVSLDMTSNKNPYAWDQLAPVLHYRGIPGENINSTVAGKFQLELFDVAGRPLHPSVALNCSTPTKIGLDRFGQAASNRVWASIAWQFTPPHVDWRKISKIRISYISNSSVNSGIQLRQLDLCSMWCRPRLWYPPSSPKRLLP